MTTYAIIYKFKGAVFVESISSKETSINLKLVYQIQREIPVNASLLSITHLDVEI